MTVWRNLLLAALLTWLGGCAVQGNLDKDNVALDHAFTQTLLDRLAVYRDGAAALDAKARQLPPPVDDGRTPAAGPPDDATAQLFYSSYELHARADLLDHFLHEGAASGQAQAMTAWLKERSARLAVVVASTDAAAARFRADAIANPADPSLPQRYFELLTRRGTERGMRDELAALDTDVAGYGRDYRGAAPAMAQPMAPPPPLP